MKPFKSLLILTFCAAGLLFQSAGIADAITDVVETPASSTSDEYAAVIRVGQSYQANTDLGDAYIYESTNFTLNNMTKVSKTGFYLAKQPGILQIMYNYHFADPSAAHPANLLGFQDVRILPESANDATALYRLYNPNSGEHFYTHSAFELDSLLKSGWRSEGVAEQAPVIDRSVPVYRVYNPNSGLHHYTTGQFEKDYLLSLGWRNEGIGWYSNSDFLVRTPNYRIYNPNSGQHHYTIGASERDHLISLGWEDEGIAWYGLKS